jgi:predicted transposase YbfD/YdcC
MVHASSPPEGQGGDLSALNRLRTAFANLPDTRQPGKVCHRLDEVLMCAFCAVMCDADCFTDMADFTETQLSWLRQFLPLEHGAPSHDVFRNVLMMVQPQALLDILARWCGSLQGLQVSIDGKTLRGTHDAELGRHRVHLLRAWVDAHGLSAGQVVCHEKSNELEAIPRLLASLELRGATVTLDAMGTQPAIAAQIDDAGADYVLALKANQKTALAAVQAAFGDSDNTPLAPGEVRPPSPPPSGALHIETLELSHGRCEHRHYQLLGELDWFHKSWKWQGLQAVGKVRREVQRSHAGPPQLEDHYFLCSFKDDVQRFADLVRGHWAVENRCHWVLDVTFGEDHCQVRDRTAAHNFSILRELVMKVLRDMPSKLSLRRQRRRAALDPSFRLQLLGALHA